MCFAGEVTSEGGPQAAGNTNGGIADGDSKVFRSIDEGATEGVSKTAEPADDGAPEEAAPCQCTQSAIVQVTALRLELLLDK